MDELLQREQNVMTAEDKKKFWDTLCELKGEDTDRERLLQTIKYPRFLYRYRPISMRSLAALSENRMYFSCLVNMSLLIRSLCRRLSAGYGTGVRLQRRTDRKASEPVKPYFTRLLRILSFCLGVSEIVNFCGNGVVNGVVSHF